MRENRSLMVLPAQPARSPRTAAFMAASQRWHERTMGASAPRRSVAARRDRCRQRLFLWRDSECAGETGKK